MKAGTAAKRENGEGFLGNVAADGKLRQAWRSFNA
jgi:hypothetical protein